MAAPADTPAPVPSDDVELIRRLESLIQAAHRAHPDRSSQLFALLRVERDGQTRDLLLGSGTSIGPEVTILDWRRAPLAEVFFAYDEGQGFEIAVDDRVISGVVLERTLLSVEGGALVEVSRGQRSWSRSAERGGEWHPIDLDGPVLRPRSPELVRRTAVPSLVPLDPVQRGAVELPAGRSLLVLGEAGFGKTTVALHRLAHLLARAKDEGRQLTTLVVVPTRGLERLSRLMLERLGAHGVEVATFESWVTAQARRCFPGLPQRTSVDATAATVRLKRHPALRSVLPDLAARRVRGRRVTRTGRDDLLHLFGDSALLERVIERAGGAIGRHAIAEIVEHTKVQFSRTTEHEHSHVDADRLVTIDGRRIDEGTPLEDAESIDVEDCAVLFEIQRLRRDEAPRGLRRYHHIVVDEAQELAPIELAILGRTLLPGGSITVAGDENQQVDDTTAFFGWDSVMAELGARDREEVVLKESYRCPPEVTRFARTIFDKGGGPIELPPARAASGPLAVSSLASACHVTARMTEEIRALESADPGATIAVIYRTPEAARRAEAVLRRGLATRLALDGDFDFRPGTVVTAVGEVKGLEFDTVILPDAGPAFTSPTPDARRALYVAVTRALHQVWIPITRPSPPPR